MGRINRFIQRCKLKIDFGRKVDSLLNRCQHLHSPSSPAIQDYLHCSDSHSAHLTALLCTSLLLDTFSHLLLLYSWISAVCLFFSSFFHFVPIFLFTLHYPRLFRSCLRFFRSIWDPKLLPPLFVQPVRWSTIDFTHRKILAKHVYFMHLFLSRKKIEEYTIPNCLHHGRCWCMVACPLFLLQCPLSFVTQLKPVINMDMCVQGNADQLTLAAPRSSLLLPPSSCPPIPNSYACWHIQASGRVLSTYVLKTLCLVNFKPTSNPTSSLICRINQIFSHPQSRAPHGRR